jgi:hypothetical protein
MGRSVHVTTHALQNHQPQRTMHAQTNDNAHALRGGARPTPQITNPNPNHSPPPPNHRTHRTNQRAIHPPTHTDSHHPTSSPTPPRPFLKPPTTKKQRTRTQGLVPQENKASDHVMAALEPFTKERGGPLLVRACVQGGFVCVCMYIYICVCYYVLCTYICVCEHICVSQSDTVIPPPPNTPNPKPTPYTHPPTHPLHPQHTKAPQHQTDPPTPSIHNTPKHTPQNNNQVERIDSPTNPPIHNQPKPTPNPPPPCNTHHKTTIRWSASSSRRDGGTSL